MSKIAVRDGVEIYEDETRGNSK